ncbi:MAG: hypothetical protein MUP16_02165 [Sedimentisphaerales bacterium]|nr:hypothetical protein [Sedimentisphaerales bacterium]
MLNGIYQVQFMANNKSFGMGLILIENGRVNGGDLSYIYQGRFDYYGDDIQALIEVKHYSGPAISVMGPLQEFSLNLSGKQSGEIFEVAGGIPGVPELSIKIVGRKVAEIFK